MTMVKNLLFYVLLMALVFQITLFLIPFHQLTEFKKNPYSLRLLDRQGVLLHILPIADGQRREYTPLEEIPHYIRDIFIRSEDKRFFYHGGIDGHAILRAFYFNVRRGHIVSGASTITMQLSRLISPHPKGFPGKISEGINALRLEAQCSKEEIFELWLNSIPFGMNTIGIASACKIYFHKDVKSITELEACLLAIVLRNPVIYNPITQPENLINPTGLLARKTGIGKDREIEEEIEKILKPRAPYDWPFNGPHFSLYVENFLTPQDFQSGKDITTTLDSGLNNLIEDMIGNALDTYRHNRLTNGAAIVFNNKTGEILSYIGSKDFHDKAHSGEIDGLHVRNQPGSCLKPFLYAQALDSGFLPNTILPDIPTDFGKDQIYTPSNFNNKFHGPVRLRVALASSLNIPAVYLITRLGVENFRQKLISLGFDSLDRPGPGFGSGLALGNAEITLFELTRAMSVFPRNGRILDPVIIKDPSHINLEKKENPKGERVFSSYAAAMMCNILSDNPSRALGFTTNSVLNTDFPAMFKTGTSNQFGNIWAIGATMDYTVGIWLGNFSGETVIGMPGSSIPAHLVVDIISLLDKKPDPFPVPENIKKVLICSLSGGLATNSCPGTLIEYLPLTASVEPCQYHRTEKGVATIHYPPLYAYWARNQLGIDGEYTPVSNQPEEARQTPYIREPADGACYYLDPSIPAAQQAVKFEIIHNNKADKLSVYVNGIKAADIMYPFTWLFQLQKGEWQIEVRDHDSSGVVRIRVK
ncbi:MAG: transglycosylase domain-containing protein [Spirochaetales bacterium]|nr:transglycosylase domain-containing protein [Spirochaetales bacterium]